MKPHCILIPFDNRINRAFLSYTIARGQSEEVLLREYARSRCPLKRAPRAPNCAPSLRSVAGLLVAR
jgi:hypothetical protein